MEFTRDASQLREIADGTMGGEAAVAVLREALQEIYMVEEALYEWRRLVAAAELRLLYGESGRPQRSPVFTERVG